MAEKNDETSHIDRIDRKILTCLHRDGRMTMARMGDEVGMSASRCWERVKRLERKAVIRGYHADIDFRRLANLSMFQVYIRVVNWTTVKSQLFERSVKITDPIISCNAILGIYDYILLVAAADPEAFNRIMEDLIAQSGVDFEYVTAPIYRTVKMASASSIAALVEHQAPLGS